MLQDLGGYAVEKVNEWAYEQPRLPNEGVKPEFQYFFLETEIYFHTKRSENEQSEVRSKYDHICKHNSFHVPLYQRSEGVGYIHIRTYGMYLHIAPQNTTVHFTMWTLFCAVEAAEMLKMSLKAFCLFLKLR